MLRFKLNNVRRSSFGLPFEASIQRNYEEREEPNLLLLVIQWLVLVLVSILGATQDARMTAQGSRVPVRRGHEPEDFYVVEEMCSDGE